MHSVVETLHCIYVKEMECRFYFVYVLDFLYHIHI